MRRSHACSLALAALALAACGDQSQPAATSPTGLDARLTATSLPAQAQDRVRWFAQASPEVMAMAEAVYASNDNATNQLVFAIDDPGAVGRVRAILARQGVPASAYRIVQSEPIRPMNTTLRTAHRPTKAGTQLQFGSYACTLGFNVDHAGGRSFITNSHCTNTQGGVEGTEYYQPLTSASGLVAVEADDPTYSSSVAGCSADKVCRYSDAARARYVDSVASSQGVIARTTGENNGSLDVAGTFTIATQDAGNTSFSGTVHKVGRTTGWSSGGVVQTCATVNVSGSNIQLLCQTLVQRRGKKIVGGGDSGSPVFRLGANNNVTLLGVLWGGSTGGDLFVFSPLKQVVQELGSMTATAGTGGDTGGGDDPTPCVPKGKGSNCK